MPTEEEAQVIAARCPQCARRGFKTCDGGTPCDTCKRQHTEGRCRQPVKVPQPQDIPSVPTATTESFPAEELSTRRRLKRRKTTADAEQLMELDETEQPSILENNEEDSSIEPREKKTSAAMIVTKPTYAALKELSEQAMQEALVKEQSLEHRTADQLQVATPEEMDFEDEHGCNVTPEDTENVHDQSAHAEDDSLPTPSASGGFMADQNESLDTLPASEDEAADAREPHQNRSKYTPAATVERPRRTRTRPSYIEALPDEVSDQELEVEDDSDLYMSNASVAETDLEDELEYSSVAGESSPDEQDDVEVEEADEIEEAGKSASKMQKDGSKRKGQITWDFGPPPLNSIEEIFDDMATKAMQLGLGPALEKLHGQPIHIATMCSGTESPIIALDMLSTGKHKYLDFNESTSRLTVTCSSGREWQAGL